MKRVLYLDTFQPYMLFHRRVLDGIAKNADEIIIGILESQGSHTLKEPFTAGERMEMIAEDLQDFSCPLYIVPIETVPQVPLMVSHIVSLVPRFSTVYTSNKLSYRAFHEAGYTVFQPAKEGRISAEEWCSLVLSKDNWMQYVSPSTRNIIDDINVISRIQRISQKD